MAMIPLRINGYSYTIGCADGEEHHLTAMAAELDARIGTLKEQAGQLGEARLLVMAALQMADEIHDLKLALQAADAGAIDAAEVASRAGEAARAAERGRVEAEAASRKAEAARIKAEAARAEALAARAAPIPDDEAAKAARAALVASLDRVAGRMEKVAARLASA